MGIPMNNRGNLFADAFTEFTLPITRSAADAQAFFAQMGRRGKFHRRYFQVSFYAHAAEYTGKFVYEHMVKTIAPYGIHGFLWYQGESDDDHPGMNVFFIKICCLDLYPIGERYGRMIRYHF